MIVKNTTQRNIRLLAPYQYTKNDDGTPAKDTNGQLLKQMSGTPFKVLIPAGATLELDDADWNKVVGASEKLVKLGYLEYRKRPDSPLTKAQIIERVSHYASVDLDSKMTRDRLIGKATQLEVDIWTEVLETDIDAAEAAEATKEMKED